MGFKRAKRRFKEKVFTGKEIENLGSHIPYGISTQSLCVDLAIGKPGIPGARLTQVYGLDGCGKSTLMAHLLASCQEMGGTSVLIDTEDAYDYDRLKRIGVKIQDLVVLEPEYLEEMFFLIKEFTVEFFKENKIGTPLLFVIDSAEGLPTKSEVSLSSDQESRQPASSARVWNAHLPNILKIVCRKYKATIVVVSQQYTSIGSQSFYSGPQMLVKGGLGLRYRASLRLEIKARQGKSGKIINENGKVVGFKNSVYVTKNKSSNPFTEADYILTFKDGIDKVRDTLEAAIYLDLLTMRGPGIYEGKIGNKKIKFKGKDKWKVVCEKFGGPDKVRALLAQQAMEKGAMTPYV